MPLHRQSYKRRPLPKPNPDRAFALKTHYKDLDPSDFNAIVKAFALRIKSWYFLQAKEIKDKIPYQGFVITQITCTLIDVISQFTYNLQESDGRYYKKFLTRYIPEFRERIRPPIVSYTYLKARKRWERVELDDFADAFWHGFRCGVVHSAMILDYGRISDEAIVGTGRVISLRQWGNGEREVAVNPFALIARLESIFESYIQDLLNPNRRQLRRNFARKFLRSFGVKVNP